MPKREITPHKGGRTERIYIRATQETKQLLRVIKQQAGKTASDVLEEAVQAIAKGEVKLTKAGKPGQGQEGE